MFLNQRNEKVHLCAFGVPGAEIQFREKADQNCSRESQKNKKSRKKRQKAVN